MQAEAQLRESEARLARTLHQTRLAYSAFDIASDKITEWSAEAADIIGVASQDLPRDQTGFLALVHPEDREAVAQAHQASRTVEGGQSQIEYRLLRPEDDVIWVRETSEVECDDSGKPIRGLSTIQDISAIRRAEETIRMRDAWLRSIFENAPFQIALKDSDGRMFAERRFDQAPIDADWIALRSRNEPVAEVFQIKGQSETHPHLSPDAAVLRCFLPAAGRRTVPRSPFTPIVLNRRANTQPRTQ